VFTFQLLKFSILAFESDSCILQFLNKLNLSKINWLRGVILLHSNSVGAWGRFPSFHTPIRPISAFQDEISILIVGCVTIRVIAQIPNVFQQSNLEQDHFYV